MKDLTEEQCMIFTIGACLIVLMLSILTNGYFNNQSYQKCLENSKDTSVCVSPIKKQE